MMRPLSSILKLALAAAIVVAPLGMSSAEAKKDKGKGHAYYGEWHGKGNKGKGKGKGNKGKGDYHAYYGDRGWKGGDGWKGKHGWKGGGWGPPGPGWSHHGSYFYRGPISLVEINIFRDFGWRSPYAYYPGHPYAWSVGSPWPSGLGWRPLPPGLAKKLPPRSGYEWRMADDGTAVLVALATGVIVGALLAGD